MAAVRLNERVLPPAPDGDDDCGIARLPNRVCRHNGVCSMLIRAADAIDPEDRSFAGAGRERSVVAVPAVGRRPLRLAVLALAVIALSSCGTSKDNDIARALTIQEFAFSPDPYRAQAGDKITVVNLDAVDHTLTADDGSLATGALKSGGRASITVDRGGVIAYHCEIHNFMRGVIRVAESSPSS